MYNYFLFTKKKTILSLRIISFVAEDYTNIQLPEYKVHLDSGQTYVSRK